MRRVRAKSLTSNSYPTPDSRIQDIEEGWDLGTDLHAVELRRAVDKFAVVSAQTTREF